MYLGRASIFPWLSLSNFTESPLPFSFSPWLHVGCRLPDERALCLGSLRQGAFFDKVGLFQAGHAPMPAGCRGCVVVDEDGKVVYAYVSTKDGEPHPGVIPPMKDIKAALGM
ncbi:unnamed protein product [Phaeothamnion confervicola]